jgi:hypothetical protein
MKVLTDKELYDKLCDSMAASRIGDPEHWCGVCVSDPLKALEGPYHQVSRSFPFAYWRGRLELISAPGLTLRNDTPEMKAKLEAMCAGQNKITEGRMTYGWDVQDPKTVLVLWSWESPEVCDLLLRCFFYLHSHIYASNSSTPSLLLDLKTRKS